MSSRSPRTPTASGLRQRLYLDDIPLATPTQSSTWTRPAKVWVEDDEDGGQLRWEGTGKPVKTGAAEEGLLTSFILLEEATPERIAQFAQKWGLLALCKHGVPNTHLPRRSWPDLDLVGALPCSETWSAGPRGESISAWRGFATQARAIHAAAANVKAAKRVPDERWENLRSLYPSGIPLTNADIASTGVSWSDARHQEHDQFLLSLAVQRWLQFGDVHLYVRWDETRGTISYGGGGLAGALALQLALTTTSTGSLLICTGCSTPYIPTRRPKPGTNHYCLDCHDSGIPARDRARRARAKRNTR